MLKFSKFSFSVCVLSSTSSGISTFSSIRLKSLTSSSYSILNLNPKIFLLEISFHKANSFSLSSLSFFLAFFFNFCVFNFSSNSSSLTGGFANKIPCLDCSQIIFQFDLPIYHRNINRCFFHIDQLIDQIFLLLFPYNLLKINFRKLLPAYDLKGKHLYS